VILPLLVIPLPLDVKGIDINAIIIAFVIVVWIVGTAVQFIRNVAARTRRRVRELQEERRQVQWKPMAPPSPPHPAQAQPPPEPRRPIGNVMADLETVLRDQLGLDLSPLQSRKKAEEAPPAESAPSRPMRPVRPMQPRPPQVSAPGAPAAPLHQRPQPARPARPMRPAAAAPMPLPAPHEEFRVQGLHEPIHAAAPTAPVAAAVSRPSVPLAAAAHMPPDAYLISEGPQAPLSRADIRRLLSGQSRRRAILLQEIIGSSRSERGWDW
jgi:hypothetical protein